MISDQPHDIRPQLTTKLSFPEGLQFTRLNSLRATFQFTTVTTISKTKPSNFDHLFNFIKFAHDLM